MKRIRPPDHKTKIICTIGPSSASSGMLGKLIHAGMNVARLNTSHGSIDEHRATIRRIRAEAARQDKIVSIMVDLPGPKIRIGIIRDAPLVLKKNDVVTLATGAGSGTALRIPVEYRALPSLVSRSSVIYLNDGFIQLKVLQVRAGEVVCRVMIGGSLLSHKGLNIPNMKSGAPAVTARDLAIAGRLLGEGVDLFGVSFVENENDIKRIRRFVRNRGKSPVIIAKIERGEAVRNIDGILDSADGIMVARGDLGVEIPIEQVPVVQKHLIRKANDRNKAVITATQMLLSMTEHIRPTRAEVTDVANAILDGTDAVMLSEETAMGTYPVEAVRMMAKIAGITEAKRYTFSGPGTPGLQNDTGAPIGEEVDDIVAYIMKHTVDTMHIRYAVMGPGTGTAPSRISKARPDCWILPLTADMKMFHLFNLTYGLHPVLIPKRRPPLHRDIVRALSDGGLVNYGDTLLFMEESAAPQGGYASSMDIVTV